MGWGKQAACRGHNTNIWFPEQGDTTTTLAATRICATCPVIYPCLTDALDRPETEGIWAGTGESTRRVMRRIRTNGHTPSPMCRCPFCTTVLRHIANINGHQVGTLNRNGPNAVCGRRSTYGRGCHCPACSFVAAYHQKETATR